MVVEGIETSLDSVLGGLLKIRQPRGGYRFSVDSILLARFAHARRRDRVLELGAGCGVVAAIIAKLHIPLEVTALEIQPGLAQLCAANAAMNSLDSMRTICADLRARSISGIESGAYDIVVANPPYHEPKTGRESPNDSRRIARGGEGANVEEFVRAAGRYLREGGRAYFVFSAYRCADIIAAMRAAGLEPKRMRFVHPRADLRASSVLIEARRGGGAETIVEPPLGLYEAPGIYTIEATQILGSVERTRRGAPAAPDIL